MTNLRRTLRLVCASVLLHATPGAAQTWSDLLKNAQGGPVEFTREIVAGDATIGIVQGGGANWVPHGILARVAWIDGVEVTLAEDLVSLTVIDRSGPAGEARVLAWSDAAPILARVLAHRDDTEPTLAGTEMAYIETDGGVMQVPQAFIKSVRVASANWFDFLVKDRNVRRKLFAEAVLRAVRLDEVRRYDGTLERTLRSSLSGATAMLGAADAVASQGLDVHEQLLLISGGGQAAQHGMPSALGKSVRALGVLAQAMQLTQEFAGETVRNRLLAAAAGDALLVLALEDAQRLLEAAGRDPAMVEGLSDAIDELAAMSRSRFAQIARAGRQVLRGSLPTLGSVAAGYAASGGTLVVAREVLELGAEMSGYAKEVMMVSALTTMGAYLRGSVEALMMGGDVGGTRPDDYSVRELAHLHDRMTAEATASVHNMLWTDRWKGVGSLARLGRAIGLAIAEWRTGDELTEEAFAGEVEWRIRRLRDSAVLGGKLPETLRQLRRFYIGPPEKVETDDTEAFDEIETDDPEGVDEIRAGAEQVFDGMEFVWVPPGVFRMGSDQEQPITRVWISRGFWLGKYEVTQTQWETVMGNNPSEFEHCGGGCPVDSVSWEDVQEFIGRLNTGAGEEMYRLPSEAEWEYAARAGTTGDTYAGDLRILGERNAPLLDDIAWYAGNSGVRYEGAENCSSWAEKQYRSERCGPHPVGRKGANAFGLHDMLGNMWEWVGDSRWRYPGGTLIDPRALDSGRVRMHRGGSWVGPARFVRTSSRGSREPDERYLHVGFRLLRTARPAMHVETPVGWDGFETLDEIRMGEAWMFDGMEFVWVPPGEFRMGSTSPDASSYTKPVTRVRISRGFWLGKYEVTQTQWESVAGTNPSWFRNCGGDCPVENVTWDDVQEFIDRLNVRVGGEVYRLPTEAEWEYAARAGTAGDTYAGDLRILGEHNAPLLDGIAWYPGNSRVDYDGATDCSGWARKQYPSERCGPHPVGGKAANRFGLHDMLGNVEEWVWDLLWRYPGGTLTDPAGESSSRSRMLRGGSWHGYPAQATAPHRDFLHADTGSSAAGLRLVRTVPVALGFKGR